MHIDPARPVHVLAVSAPRDRIPKLVAGLGGATAGVRAAPLGAAHAILTRSLPGTFPPAGVGIGIGPALPAIDAPESWRQARTALRFTTLHSPEPAVVRADQLGALAVIAQRLRADDIARVADLRVLDRLADESNGADTLAILTAFCVTGSARKAATEVYRHHSTVTARIAQAESELGFAVGTPGGRLRLELALLLRHLRDTAE
jgi:sugar diacid utilization regulator